MNIYIKILLEEKSSPITHIIYKKSPSKNIGFLPLISAILGRIKEPIKHPMKKQDPIMLSAKSLEHSKSYCSTQLCIASFEKSGLNAVIYVELLHIYYFVHSFQISLILYLHK